MHLHLPCFLIYYERCIDFNTKCRHAGLGLSKIWLIFLIGYMHYCHIRTFNNDVVWLHFSKYLVQSFFFQLVLVLTKLCEKNCLLLSR